MATIVTWFEVAILLRIVGAAASARSICCIVGLLGPASMYDSRAQHGDGYVGQFICWCVCVCVCACVCVCVFDVLEQHGFLFARLDLCQGPGWIVWPAGAGTR